MATTPRAGTTTAHLPWRTSRVAASRRTRALRLATAVAVLAAAACAGGADVTGEFSVERLVAALPAPEEPDRLEIHVGDLDAASAAAGLERPVARSGEEVPAWLFALTGGRGPSDAFVPLPQELTNEIRANAEPELGWDVLDVATFAEIVSRPDWALLVTGDFDDDTLSPDLTDLGYGVVSAGDGEDRVVTVGESTPLRPTGMPLRLARDGDAILVAPMRQQVQDWVQGEDRDTLADHPALMDVAARLDSEEVYAAALATGFDAQPLPGADPADVTRREQELAEWGVREAFEVAAVGWATREDEPVVVAAYHFGSDDVAQRAAEQVESVWEQGTDEWGQPLVNRFALQEVTQHGPVVVAVLHLAGDGLPAHAYTMLIGRDAPFSHP